MRVSRAKKCLTKAQKIILIFKVLRDEPSLGLGNRDLLELASRLVEVFQQDKTKIDKIKRPLFYCAHKTENKTQSTTIYRLLGGGNLATAASSFLQLF